ncbi:MAG TPA: hypothetical protein DEQ64_01920 [Lachnoclostridium sp.]|uniref:hypothetical protein n=1 Tax=Lacrimispora sp. TaxID=2719234 RepID=UPI000EDA7FDE|nr:hypothetical protein [Lacrimispora sp.]HCD42495.1 hypothetical protein [Lachnoclostridium sp.]
MESILDYIDKSSDSSGISCIFAAFIPIVPVWRKAQEYTDINRVYDIFLCDIFYSDYNSEKKRKKGRRTNRYTERNRNTKDQ